MKFDYEKLFGEARRKRITQTEIAETLGITQTTLSRKMTGKAPMELTATQVVLICEMLESPIDMFVTKEVE